MKHIHKNYQFFYALVCDKKPVKDDPDFFEQYVEFNGWVKMPCAPGTHFNAEDCHCTVMAVFNTTTGNGTVDYCLNLYTSICQIVEVYHYFHG